MDVKESLKKGMESLPASIGIVIAIYIVLMPVLPMETIYMFMIVSIIGSWIASFFYGFISEAIKIELKHRKERAAARLINWDSERE